MTDSPHISIVMSVYNRSDLLPETLESVRAQTECDWELIVINDGSSDRDVRVVLEQFAATEPRARIVHKENEGLTRALISGCAMARGKYIARIDAGDIMQPERLEAQLALLSAHPNVVLATCGTEFCGPAWEPLFSVVHGPCANTDQHWVASFPKDDRSEERLYGPTHHGSVMFRRDAYEAAGGYRREFYFGQDWDLWYRLAEQGRFSGINTVLYRCRLFPDAISMAEDNRQRQIHACARRAFMARQKQESEHAILAEAAAIQPQKSRSASCAAGYYFIGANLLKNGDKRCRRYLWQAIKENPFHLRAWLGYLRSVVRR